ncbi:phosphatidylserine decarboxylase [Ekhidna sp.]|uniref:phosphatidylserine decarboxylase n=1 Tax=Ekhidna sp. TaxID=2608089 RepID=UPI003296E569
MKLLQNLLFVFALTAMVCSCNTSKENSEYGKATTELISLVESNPELKSMLITSIQKTKEINPDRRTNPVQNLEEYYEFINWAETSMPWSMLKKEDYPEIYNNILQSVIYFYFLIDQPLAELEGKAQFRNSLQYYDPFASWVTAFCKTWGNYLDSEISWNEEYYQMALADVKFGLQNDWYESPKNWKTFNQFFARKLKSAESRPISSPNLDSIVVSYADSEPQGQWPIDSSSLIIQNGGVKVKSATLSSVASLIGDDSEYEDEFANGTFTHSFLNVNDYHRYHFPIGGIVKEVRIIPGINPIGASIFWDAKNRRYAFDPSLVGWQTVETRGCVILETDEYGLVALLPIGMAVVGSVNFEENLKIGTKVNKGDMLGFFLFGGSDFIMIFQENVAFTLDSPMQEDSNSYKHILMGERLGYLTKKK